MKRFGLVLCLAFGCQHGGKKIEVDEGPGRPYPRLIAAEIVGLRIERAGAPDVVLRRQGDDWKVVEPEPGPADPRALQFSVRELEHMEFDSDPLPDADESWADEVVVHPQAAARALPALHLSPRHHLRIGDDAAVWRTHNIDYYTFAREVRFWRLGTVP